MTEFVVGMLVGAAFLFLGVAVGSFLQWTKR